MQDTLVGVDIAKAVFQLAVSSRSGRFDGQSRLRRDQVLPFFAQLPAAIVIMEACGSAHFWRASSRNSGTRWSYCRPTRCGRFVKRNKTTARMPRHSRDPTPGRIATRFLDSVKPA
jgi:transposase